MILNLKNENYGWVTSTFKDWMAVGNPSSFRYNGDTSASFLTTGSVDIYKYNPTKDEHDYVTTLYKPINTFNALLLACDPSSSLILHTELSGSDVFSNDLDIAVNDTEYKFIYEDGYGFATDIYENILGISSIHNKYKLQTDHGIFATYTGSVVDIYNLGYLYYNPFTQTIATSSQFYVTAISASSNDPLTGSFGAAISVNEKWLAVSSPLYDNRGAVHLFQAIYDTNRLIGGYAFHSTITASDSNAGDNFGISVKLNKATGSYSGSLIVGTTRYTSAFAYYYEYEDSIWKEKAKLSPDHTTYNLNFYDIDPIVTYDNYIGDGFGKSVAINKDTIVVGAPTDRFYYEYSGSSLYKQGAVYIFEKCDLYPGKWNLSLKSYGNSGTLKNNKLGYSVDVYNGNIVAGCPKNNIDSTDLCYIRGTLFQQDQCTTDLENNISGQYILFSKNTSSLDWDIINNYRIKKKFLQPFRGYGHAVSISDKFISVGAPIRISGSHRAIDLTDIGYTSSLDTNGGVTGKGYVYNFENLKDSFFVGNVFYRNGKLVINTSGSSLDNLFFNNVDQSDYSYKIKYQSKQSIYEKQIVCNIAPGEFNVSTNPTALVSPNISFDINKNGKFDFQDLDVILMYMQWKTTQNALLQTTDWTSSIVSGSGEVSYLNAEKKKYINTYDLYSSSYSSFETLFGDNNQLLDINADTKADINDIKIFWKYYSNRLDQDVYKQCINPNSNRKYFTDAVIYLDEKTGKFARGNIKPEFFNYETKIKADPTGSYLVPYITTVGLYQGLDLIATAKLGTPIRLTPDFPLNIVVKIDF